MRLPFDGVNTYLRISSFGDNLEFAFFGALTSVGALFIFNLKGEKMDKKIRTPFAAILLILTAALNVFQFTDICIEIFRFGKIFNVFTAITLGIELVLCGVLFAKKYNNILVIVLGCQTIIPLYYLVRYFSIVKLLDFVAYALLAIFALAVCEQTLVKADLTKIKELFSKLFYLPAIINLVLGVCDLVTFANRGGNISVITIADILLNGIILLNLGMWLKDPYTKEKPITETDGNSTNNMEEQGEAYCGLGKHILLLLFTFGIWNLIWTYRTTKYLNKTPNAEYYNPTSKLLLCMFVPFYTIYWYYRHGQRIDSFTKSKGLNGSDMATLCLILGIFIPIVACILMQDKINTICTSKETKTVLQEQPEITDELKKYKELLDSGVITQEEFDAKKKQLLGL